MSVKKFVVYTVLALGAVVFWCHTHSDRAKIARLFDSAAKIAERSPDARFSVPFSDLDITVDGLTAHVEGHVRIDGADGFLKTKIRDARPFAAELEKNDDGEWKIVAVTLLKYSNT